MSRPERAIVAEEDTRRNAAAQEPLLREANFFGTNDIVCGPLNGAGTCGQDVLVEPERIAFHKTCQHVCAPEKG